MQKTTQPFLFKASIQKHLEAKCILGQSIVVELSIRRSGAFTSHPSGVLGFVCLRAAFRENISDCDYFVWRNVFPEVRRRRRYLIPNNIAPPACENNSNLFRLAI